MIPVVIVCILSPSLFWRMLEGGERLVCCCFGSSQTDHFGLVPVVSECLSAGF